MNRIPRVLARIAVTAAAFAAVVIAATLRAEAQATSRDAGPRDYVELRAYRLKAGASSDLLDSYLEKALIPALNARGVKAVGAFTESEPKEGPIVWVLIPHSSFESFVSVSAAINADEKVVQAGADYLSAPTKANPAFERIDSWLYLNFAGQPHVDVPGLAKKNQPRILEMRMYESHSESKALKKMQMFNEGEIAVMQEVELSPVFFGQALTGPGLPRLVYLLCSPDRETHAKNWKRFQQHPRWIEQKGDPQYKDTVSRSDNRFLVPKPYSQI